MLTNIHAMHQPDEIDLITRASSREETAIRTIIQRYNQRLFRLARSILRDDAEAEDALQEAYIRVFNSLGTFEHKSALSTWLSRIVMNEAYSRLRKQRSMPIQHSIDHVKTTTHTRNFSLTDQYPDPEKAFSYNQIMHFLELAIDSLPDDFRVVLVARTIEEMSIEETAELFGIKPQTVKTRLHRARALLQAKLESQTNTTLNDIFTFAGSRCQHIADEVIRRLGNTHKRS